MRWYGGAFDLQRRYLARCCRLAWRGRSPDALDKLLELALPPFSLLALGAALLLLQCSWPGSGGPRLLASPSRRTGRAGGPVPLPGPGCAPARRRVPTRPMLAGPIYILWRVWIGLRVRLRYRSVTWVRTRRTDEEDR